MTEIFRFPEEVHFRNTTRRDNIDTYWDSDYDLVDHWGWEARINYESHIIKSIIETHKTDKILELGCGTGNLGDKVIRATDVTYHMIDGESAKRAHARRSYKGEIIIKDLLDSFDTNGLQTDYNLVIANDFIEHIRNPSLVLETVREKLTTKDAYFFASTPNWRMKHHFYYPGLFDFDNFVKFFHQEGFDVIEQWESWSTNVNIRDSKLDSEQLVPDSRLYDWNYYLLFERIK